jgi:serine/threonine protein kinase
MYYTMTSTDPARKTSITTHRIFCPIHFREVDLASLVPTLAAMGVDFLNKMMQHDPARRITAQRALQHRFFFDMVGRGI